MKRRHEMPFGAQCQEDGTVRFRLWAPAANRVELSLKDATLRLPLKRADGGWFELTTDAGKPGALYRFRIDGGNDVPDPASRFQPQDVHGPSQVVDPLSFDWQDGAWRGRRWEDAVIYELHAGTFAASGKFSGVEEKLDYLVDLGITALELMPISDFPGKRNWGYDGVFPFAPDSSYGRPEDLKSLVQSAHQRGLMVFLDVVYNHFGPEGNYLRAYAPQFFTDRHRTPWGDGINFDGPESRVVRDFFIHNALYWLTEFHLDGLRFDAVNAIVDDSQTHILTELAETARRSIAPNRHIHLILENDSNQARYLQRGAHCKIPAYTAQWNDDLHHVLHVLLTGERDGYYADYSASALEKLGRCLTSGFVYQGEPSPYRNHQPRGESTAGLPPAAFVSFLQNHDQIGNRAYGERITQIADAKAVRAALSILLLAPSPPLLFMGEEFAASTPFLFFCDFEKDLAAAVTEGRRNEFARFSRFCDSATRETIPDPGAAATFQASRLDWSEIGEPNHLEWLEFYRRLLALRCQHLTPALAQGCACKAEYSILSQRALSVSWELAGHARFLMWANLGAAPASNLTPPSQQLIYACAVTADNLEHGILPPWSVAWFLDR